MPPTSAPGSADAADIIENQALRTQKKALGATLWYRRLSFFVWGWLIMSALARIYTLYQTAATSEAYATLRKVVDEAHAKQLVQFTGLQVALSVQTPLIASVFFLDRRLPSALAYAATMKQVDFTPEVVQAISRRAQTHFNEGSLALVCNAIGLDTGAQECLSSCPVIPNAGLADAVTHVASNSGLGAFAMHTVSNTMMEGSGAGAMAGAGALLFAGVTIFQKVQESAKIKKQCAQMAGLCRQIGAGACAS